MATQYTLNDLCLKSKASHITLEHQFHDMTPFSSITGKPALITKEKFDTMHAEADKLFKLPAVNPNQLLVYPFTIDDFIRALYWECQSNIWFFFENFCFIPSPESTTEKPMVTKFEMTAEADLIIRSFIDGRNLLLYHSRLSGFTTTIAAIMAYVEVYHADYDCIVKSRNNGAGNQMKDLIKVIVNNIPGYAKSPSPYGQPVPRNHIDYPKYVFLDDFEYFPTINVPTPVSNSQSPLYDILRPVPNRVIIGGSTIHEGFEKSPEFQLMAARSFRYPVDSIYDPFYMIEQFNQANERNRDVDILMVAFDEHMIFPQATLDKMKESIGSDEDYACEVKVLETLSMRAQLNVVAECRREYLFKSIMI